MRILSGLLMQGTVLGPATAPRSYEVVTAGGTVRRTSRHLQPIQEENPQAGDMAAPMYRTRSGRAVKPPDRFVCK